MCPWRFCEHSVRGVKAKVIEVKSIEDLALLGKQRIEGRIVFFNMPMKPTSIITFDSYFEAVDQTYSSALESAKYGAVGVIIRSLNFRLDDFPHTETMTYGDNPVENRIPAAAISTKGADLLSVSLKLNPDIYFYFKQYCQQYDDVQSYNVIGEITGTTHPNEIIVVAGRK